MYHVSGNQYRLTSHVDSQNSFGAMLRSKFVCTATETSKDNWRVDSVLLER
jgi:hypothetical protein